MNYYAFRGFTRSITRDIVPLIPASIQIGAPLCVYSILFTYYDPGAEGFDCAFYDDRIDIVMMYMRMRSGKRIHVKYVSQAIVCGWMQLFDYATDNGMWTGDIHDVYNTACTYDCVHAVTKLLPHVDVHGQDDSGLFRACSHSCERVVSLLLARDEYSGVTLNACICATYGDIIKKMLYTCKRRLLNYLPHLNKST